MTSWIWVLPSEAVVGNVIAGRRIVRVSDKKRMRSKSLCEVTLRLMWPGYYQMVMIE